MMSAFPSRENRLTLVSADGVYIGVRMTMITRRCLSLLTLCVSGFMTGCVQFESKPLDPGRTAESLAVRTLSDPGLLKFLAEVQPSGAYVYAERLWTLDELTAAALYLNPNIDLARQRSNVAASRVKGASERPNPSVSASPGYNSSSSGISPWIFGLGFSFPIETAGKRQYRTDEARHLAEAARLRVATDAWRIRTAVREAFLDLAEAQEAAGLEAAVVAASEALCAAMERQRAAGEFSRLDLTQAQVELHRARLAASGSQARRTVALARLAAAMGLPSSALEHAAFRFGTDAPDAPDTAEARRAALTGRADVLAALKDYEASQSALQLAIAGQYPDLQIGPGYEFDQSENKWSLGASLSLPVFHQNQGAIGKALAQREEAAAAVFALQSRIAGEVDQALAAVRAAEGRASAAAALLASTAQRLAVVESLQQAGEVTTLDVLAARAEVAGAKLDEGTVRMERRRALGKLEDALQRPADLPENLWSQAPTVTRN
jgi:outer membrane protein TolC